MKDTRITMGMPVTIEVLAPEAEAREAAEIAFAYFRYADDKFSTYKDASEIMRINRGEIAAADASDDMREILALAEATRAETDQYFDIRRPDGSLDPSGIVKGWAIRKAAGLIRARGIRNFYIEAGGDIEAEGLNALGEPWLIGIRNPFETDRIVKTLEIKGPIGVATSGTYLRGEHIYNPKKPGEKPSGVASLTVIGPDAYEADRFATAAFAMGRDGIYFIENLPGFEGYMIDRSGVATLTTGFHKYVHPTLP